MNIFRFWKKVNKEEPDFDIVSGEAKKAFPWAQVLLRAILINLLVFGSLGGMLAAFDISYNILLCVMVITALSICYGVVYVSGKRWLVNIVLLVSLAGYFVYAFQCYWYVNSGYYSVLNHILAEARSYLAIFNGTEYELVIDNEYMAVTYFVIFVGFIGVLLLSILFARSFGLIRVMVLTLPFYFIPMYFEENPGMGYLLMLWTGYAFAALLYSLQKGKGAKRQWVYLLAMVGGFLLCARLFTWIVPLDTYQANVQQNALKRQSEKQIGNWVQS
ncbi:MAG: hypothetical protein IJ833_08760, partial [Lachnospiraceae bacterium]|nr:hypothetical protein [Lachnospiraceae bacterium]